MNNTHLKLKKFIRSAHCYVCNFAPFCKQNDKVNSQLKSPRLVKRQLRLEKQATIAHSQEACQSLYIVNSGILKASDLEPNGKERIISFYLPGEILGFEAIHEQAFPYAIAALTQTVVCEIALDDLLIFSTNQIEFQRKLLKWVSQRLNIGGYVSSVRAEQRVAGFLLELADRLHSNPSAEFLLPMSRQVIGDYLGLAGETIIRIIKRLHKNKVLSVHKKKIKLLDIPKLHWLADGGLLETAH